MRRKLPPSPLPVRDGVCASRLYLQPGPWRTLWDFMLHRFPHVSHDVLKRRLDNGDIVDGDGRPQQAGQPYRAHQWLWYYRDVPDEVALPFDLPIIHADDVLVVVDKPHFMATTPAGRYLRETALVRLRRQLGIVDLTPVHRLDRDTAGVVMFCIDPKHRGAYQRLFQERQVDKEYEAVAPWRPGLGLPRSYCSRMVEGGGKDFRMAEIPGPPNSETRIELIDRLADGLAHYRLMPVSGKKHQLRVHMNGLGIPIANDEMYPDLLPMRAADDFSHPLQLLARSIAFADPLSGLPRRFVSQRRLDMAHDVAGASSSALPA
ncbi:MAG TPA: pseudouridine synthase [Burkholderiaceae bacterium]|nr:pseudouridine synthase [Burkholderiaceae bacterium]